VRWQARKVIDCLDDMRVEVEGEEIIMCYPQDTCVLVCKFDASDVLVPVRGQELEDVLPATRECLASRQLTLVESAVILTAKGPIEEYPPGSGGDVGAEALDPEEDWVRVLATFEVPRLLPCHVPRPRQSAVSRQAATAPSLNPPPVFPQHAGGEFVITEPTDPVRSGERERERERERETDQRERDPRHLLSPAAAR